MSNNTSIDLARLLPGMIFARKHFEFWDSVALKMGNPYTDYVHFAVLAGPADDGSDWLTFDTPVKSRMTLVPLSRYKGQMVRIYSVKNGDPTRAYIEANRLLESGIKYEDLAGWTYLLRLLPSLFSFWLKHGPKAIPWDAMPNVDRQDRINCLVLVRRCYPDLIPDNVCASASAMEHAYHTGKLILEQEGTVA